MFVVTEGVGDANSGGVLCSGPSSSAKRFTQWFIQQIGTFRSYGAKPRVAIDRYKHCIPTGFFVRLNNLRKKTKDIQTSYTEETKTSHAGLGPRCPAYGFPISRIIALAARSEADPLVDVSRSRTSARSRFI